MKAYPKLVLLRTAAVENLSSNPNKLPPLFHLHIPKCAGTTLEEILVGLAKAKSRPYFRIPGTIYHQKFSGTGKAEACESIGKLIVPPNWLCASGHVPYGIFPTDASSVNQVTMIREPLTRYLSLFRMGVRRGVWSSSTPVQQIFKSRYLVEDSMVRQLAGVASGETRLSEEDVEKALRNYESITYKGTLEEFENVAGSILSDYGIEFIAFHRFQVDSMQDDIDGSRLAREFAPFLQLDQMFFERAKNISRQETRRFTRIEMDEVPPKSWILLVTPFLYQNNQQIRSAFIDVEGLRKFFA